jgi:hypothetical protein
MSRKLAIILIAIAVAMVFAITVAVAGDPPTQITIDKGMAKKSGVAFDHTKHEKAFDCFKCHHASKTKDEIKSCFECHGKDASAPTIKDAFHKSCIVCHKEQGKGPTKCSECHPK